MKDNLEKYICKNERQLVNKINEGAKIVMCYNFNLSEEIVNRIKEQKIKIIGLQRPIKKRGKRKDN